MYVSNQTIIFSYLRLFTVIQSYLELFRVIHNNDFH